MQAQVVRKVDSPSIVTGVTFPAAQFPRDMKKDKAVVIESPSSNEEEEDAAATNHSARRFSTRNPSSKYDFVKVYMTIYLPVAAISL